MQLIEYKNEVTSQCKKAGLNSRIPSWLLAVEQEALSTKPYWFMVDNATLTTVSGQETYVLDERISGRRISKMNDETNDSHVCLEHLSTVLWADPTPSEAGDPYSFSFEGLSRIKNQPTTDGTLTFYSNESSDTSKYITVTGLSGGIVITETKQTDSINGTTSVTTDNSFDSGGLISIEKESGFVGTLTVKGDGATLTVVTVRPGVSFFEAPKIRFYNVPDSALTLRYYFYKKPFKLTNDYQSPMIPYDFHWSVGLNGVLSIAYYNNNDFAQGQIFEANMNKGIQKMNNWGLSIGKNYFKSKSPYVSLNKYSNFDYSEVESVGTP